MYTLYLLSQGLGKCADWLLPSSRHGLEIDAPNQVDDTFVDKRLTGRPKKTSEASAKELLQWPSRKKSVTASNLLRKQRKVAAWKASRKKKFMVVEEIDHKKKLIVPFQKKDGQVNDKAVTVSGVPRDKKSKWSQWRVPFLKKVVVFQLSENGRSQIYQTLSLDKVRKCFSCCFMTGDRMFCILGFVSPAAYMVR